MRPDRDDAARLLDMLEACERVVRYTSSRSLADFEADDYFRSAVERQIEIVGEAARGVSDKFKQLNPDVPWRPIVAQRHILAHEYGEIQAPLVWRVATLHIPRLATQLRNLISASGNSTLP